MGSAWNPHQQRVSEFREDHLIDKKIGEKNARPKSKRSGTDNR